MLNHKVTLVNKLNRLRETRTGQKEVWITLKGEVKKRIIC